MKEIAGFVKIFFFSVFFAATATVYAQEIINPAEGTWANRQVLVLDTGNGYNAYYSLNGDDPESSGLAYDGPVALDVSGSVKLSVVFVNFTGRKIRKELAFYIEDSEPPPPPDAADFIQKFPKWARKSAQRNLSESLCILGVRRSTRARMKKLINRSVVCVCVCVCVC